MKFSFLFIFIKINKINEKVLKYNKFKEYLNLEREKIKQNVRYFTKAMLEQ